MRSLPVCMVLLSSLCIPTFASPSKNILPEEEALASLERRAEDAPVRAQCYLYAELVHETIRYSANQYAAGNAEYAGGLLKRSQGFLDRVRDRIAKNTKKIKEAQILLRRASYLLTDFLHVTSAEDEPLVQETLSQVNRTQDDLMLQVFSK